MRGASVVVVAVGVVIVVVFGPDELGEPRRLCGRLVVGRMCVDPTYWAETRLP